MRTFAIVTALMLAFGTEALGQPLPLGDVNGDSQVRILAFGDSITAGVGDGDEPSDRGGGYPPRLEAILGVPILNAGRPGETSDRGATRIPGVLAEAAADFVILLEGANDVGGFDDPRDVIRELQEQIDSAFAASTMPLIGTLTPQCCNQGSERVALVAAINREIRELAAENGIPVVDFFDAMTPGGDDPAPGVLHEPEGLHPTPFGYDVMAERADDSFERVKRCAARAVTILGTEGDDVIVGTPGPDVIHGLGGNDVIRGLRGNDVICGGPGADFIHGGGGADLVIGNTGDDFLIGGGGSGDEIRGGVGQDTCEDAPEITTFRNCELPLAEPAPPEPAPTEPAPEEPAPDVVSP